MAAPAGATPPVPLPESVTTAHFVVHYTTAVGDANAITAPDAQQIAANAENAYAVEVGAWGFPAPQNDGDGHVDIDVFQFTDAWAGHATSSVPVGTSGTQFSGSIELTVRWATGRSIVAHEFFHILQYGMFAPMPAWVDEGSARWAEHEGAWGDGWSTATDRSYLAHPEMPFDCVGAGCPNSTWDGGYERWLFWSYLSNRYGRSIVREFFDGARTAFRPGINNVLAPFDATLRAHGTTLAQAWNDFVVANALRSYPAVAASGQTVATLPTTVGSTVSTSVSHLAARYVEIAPSSSACATVPLHVRITKPPGVGVPAVVIGSQSLAAPDGAVDTNWNPCGPHPVVVLPNATTYLDAQPFTVQTSVGDTPPATTPTTTTTPTQTTTPGPTSSDRAPSIVLAGMPAVVRISAARPVLLFSLSANAEGSVTLTWDGGVKIGTYSVRPGSNSFRISLPRGLRGRKTLILTGVSPAGTTGTPLRQSVLFVR